MKTPFLGGFSVSRSQNLADNRLVNLYVELADTKTIYQGQPIAAGKEVGVLLMTPGLDLLVTLG